MAVGRLPIDHLVVAGPDLGSAAQRVAEVVGEAPIAGGQHRGRGTRNELVGLGDGCYVEVIGPDPDQPDPPAARSFGIDDFAPHASAALIGVAVRAMGETFDAHVARLSDRGIPTEVRDMTRTRPDGIVLEWRLAVPVADPIPGLFPFVIDWMTSDHPSASLGPVATLRRLRIGHPQPEHVSLACKAFGIECEVFGASSPQMIATLATPSGEVELR
jgi:hypothetical protein